MDAQREDTEVVEDEQGLPGAAQLVQEVRWIRPGQSSLETQDLLLQEEDDMETQGLLTGVAVENQVNGNKIFLRIDVMCLNTGLWIKISR